MFCLGVPLRTQLAVPTFQGTRTLADHDSVAGGIGQDVGVFARQNLKVGQICNARGQSKLREAWPGTTTNIEVHKKSAPMMGLSHSRTGVMVLYVAGIMSAKATTDATAVGGAVGDTSVSGVLSASGVTEGSLSPPLGKAGRLRGEGALGRQFSPAMMRFRFDTGDSPGAHGFGPSFLTVRTLTGGGELGVESGGSTSLSVGMPSPCARNAAEMRMEAWDRERSLAEQYK